MRAMSLRFLALCLLAACGPDKPANTGGGDPTSSLASSEPTPKTAPLPPSKEVDDGVKAFEAGDYPKAQASFEAAIKKNPGNYEAHYNLAMVHVKENRAAEAEKSLREALKLKSDLETASVALSAILIDSERYDEAIKVARDGLSKHPKNGDLHQDLGLALAKKGDQDGSLKAMEMAAKLKPDDPETHILFAQILNAWKVKGAAAHLDHARGLAKSDVKLLATIGNEFRLAGEFQECVKTYDRAIAAKDGGEVRTGRAICKIGLKDEAGALADLKEAVKVEPKFAPGHYHLGNRLASEKKFKEAAAEYEACLANSPSPELAGQAKDKLAKVKELMGAKK
jgi:tetratricopeptide (TPR) repeat protein